MDPTQAPPIAPPAVPSPMGDPSQIPPQGQPDGSQPVSDQQKQALLDLIGQIREKLSSLGATKFASSNKTESFRRDLLKQVFEKLQMAGVDLTDQQSVATFMAKLQQSNPELAQGFEKAMEVLLGGTEGGQFATPQDPNAQADPGVLPQDNMNNPNPNEAIPAG